MDPTVNQDYPETLNLAATGASFERGAKVTGTGKNDKGNQIESALWKCAVSEGALLGHKQ